MKEIAIIAVVGTITHFGSLPVRASNSESKVALSARQIRFSPEQWKTQYSKKVGSLVETDRLKEFCQFLRDYNLIGMSRQDILALLGPSESNNALALYTVRCGECGNSWQGLEIEFLHNKLYRWRMADGWDLKGDWISKNVILPEQLVSGTPWIKTALTEKK